MDFALPEHLPGLLAEMDAFIDAVISVAILDRPDRRAAKIRRLAKDGLYEAPDAWAGRL